MPRWLVYLLALLILFVFVLPNPVQAGYAVGNAVDSVIIFFRNVADEVDIGTEINGTAPTPGTSASGADNSGRSRNWAYPYGGVASGDGTTGPSGDGALLLGLESPSVHAPAGALASEATLGSSPPVQLHVPSIGVVTTRFVGLGLNPDGTLEVPLAATVVGWYRDAPTPGEWGPAVMTAHVDWRHERGVFHDLRQVQPGDEITVERADGVAVVFHVSRVEEYPKERFPTDEVYGSTDEAELRLITCGGRYDADTGSYEANIVVFARMVGVM